MGTPDVQIGTRFRSLSAQLSHHASPAISLQWMVVPPGAQDGWPSGPLPFLPSLVLTEPSPCSLPLSGKVRTQQMGSGKCYGPRLCDTGNVLFSSLSTLHLQ